MEKVAAITIQTVLPKTRMKAGQQLYAGGLKFGKLCSYVHDIKKHVHAG